MITKLPVGNGLVLILQVLASATRIVLLRNSVDLFSGFDDPNAVSIYDGLPENSVIDTISLANGVPVYYRLFSLINGVWYPSVTVSATPSASLIDVSSDPLTIVRDRLELGLQPYVASGALNNDSGFIPVFTASPFIEDAPLPIVTVHLASDGSDQRFIGDVMDSFTDADGNVHSVDGWLSRYQLTIVGWSLNADGRINLRNAMKAVMEGNLPVFDNEGMTQIDMSFSDSEDFQSYNAPVFMVTCNFSCYAPTALDSVGAPISSVESTLII